MAAIKRFGDLQVNDFVYLLTPTSMEIKDIMVDAVAKHKNPIYISLNLRLDLSHKSPKITMEVMDIARKEGVNTGQKVIVPCKENMILLAQNVPTVLSTDKQLLLDWVKNTGGGK